MCQYSGLTVRQKHNGFPRAETCAPMRTTCNVLPGVALLGATHVCFVCVMPFSDHAEQHNLPPEGSRERDAEKEGEQNKLTSKTEKGERRCTTGGP